MPTFYIRADKHTVTEIWSSVKSFSITPHTCRVCSISVPVRLVGGSSSREGRLEVYFMGVWGTVCDDGFTDAAARVVCYMLGYG